MESNRLIKLSLGIMIAVIITATALMPVISDATKTEDTYYNEGYFRMSKVGTDTDLSLDWDPATPNTFTINGEDVVLTFASDVTVSILPDTNFTVRAIVDSTGTVTNIQYYLATGGAHSANGAAFSLSATGGTATLTISGQAASTAPYDVIYYPDPNGDYVMKYGNTPAYMNKDSEFFACGTSQCNDHEGRVGSQILGTEITGSIEDGMTVSLWRTATSTPGDTITVKSDSAAMVSSAVSTHIDLYKLSALNYVALFTEPGTPDIVTENNISYTYFIVPYKVTAELSQHLNSGQIAMINAIPFVVIAAILVAAVGMMMLRKE